MAAANKVGFLEKPKQTAIGKIYRGLREYQDVQWIGIGDDRFATFTVTAEELADSAASGLLWTDQDVQRGIKPEVRTAPPRELSLAEGYPDSNLYIFSDENADDIVEKLLAGRRLFLSPLVWNLRPGEFVVYSDSVSAELYLYEGRIYLPDSHHRQQAIVKAVNIYRDAPSEYPKFSLEKQFKVELYFLSREDEGNYFFDKNQRPRPTAKSKAFDLTTEDDLSILAKRTIANSSSLINNVNRVTDRLTRGNDQLITLSTLREMMRTFASEEEIDAAELDGLAVVAAEFFDMLQSVRPELGRLDRVHRNKVRENLVVDAAVMMHGYAAIMRVYNVDLAKMGRLRARSHWQARLKRLSSSVEYSFEKWKGDFFAKDNPLWLRSGVSKFSRNNDRLTVTNTGASRAECGRILRQHLIITNSPLNLSYLVER